MNRKKNLNGDPLLAVDGLAGDHVPRDESVLFAVGDKDALVPVRLDGHLGATGHATATTTGTTTTAATTATYHC